MTTEQMDWVDDTQPGRHKITEPVVLHGEPSIEQIAAARDQGRGVLIVPNGGTPRYVTAGWFRGDRDSVPDDSADPVLRTVLAELGFEADTDPVYAARKRMRQLQGANSEYTPEEMEKLMAEKARAVHSDETTKAEEPIEDRLRRAWLNGYSDGFREGMERGSYIGRDWDRR